MKKSLSLILALVMLIGLLPMNVFATEGASETQSTEATVATEATEAVEEVVVSETEEEHTHEYTSEVTDPTCTEKGYTTYTCECGDSYVDDYADETGHNYENGICTGCGMAAWDTDGDGALEILAIGNSFSVDALQYAYQISQNLGIEEIIIGNLYIGGCSLNTHATNAAGDLGKYTYYYNDNGTWTSTQSYKISTALESRSWDYVSLQQASNYSGVESTYNEDLTDLISYVQERSDAKLVWHMTWAYQQNSTHSAFPTYNKDQMTMYNAIVSAVQNKIVTNSNFDLIVPNGTAVQNSRTSLLGDTTTRDGYHMSYDYGRYLTGLLFIKTVTGLPVDNITYAPSGVDAQEMAVAIESVNNASAKPFAVTESAYVEEEPEIPDEGYVLLQPELYKGAFWHPIKEGRYNELIYDQTNSKQFFATIRFTRETLPVGSIIILADGWQYRPDGWITDELQTGTREATTTETYVVVTEEWWGDYTIRAFNISKVGLPSLTNVSEEEVRSAFQIYVPEEKHSHTYTSTVTAPTCTEKGYTTCTCILCGDSYVDGYTDPNGHTFGGWSQVTAPTCDAEGQDKRACADCGHEQFRDTRISGNPNKILVSDPVGEDYFSGKKLLLIGDSITYGVGVSDRSTEVYGQIVGKELGMTVTNKGVSGSGYCTGGAMSTNKTLTEANVRDADVITIMLGINDWAWSVKEGFWNGKPGYYDESETYYQLGEFGSDDTSTFYGALKWWCETIVELKKLDGFEEKQFVVITPMITSWNNSMGGKKDWNQDKLNVHGHTLRQYCTVIMEVCAEYDIPVLDANMFSGIYYNNAEDNNVTETGGDGVHVNAAGHALLAQALEEFLLEGYAYESRNVYDCGHNFEKTVTEATCTEDGFTTYRCSECHYSYVDDYVDSTGHSYEGGICTGCGEAQPGPVIIQQPESVEQEVSKKFAITVKAEGENLTYQWYYKDAGMKNFGVSSNKTSAYAYTMQSYMHKRQVYCVVTDSNGNQTTTDTATITRPPLELEILTQPADVQTPIGQKFSVSPKMRGDGLTYQWYYKDAGMKNFGVSSNKSSAYAYTMASYMHNRQVYCVITDQYGNQVTTDVATITRPPMELKVLSQPVDVYAAKGEKFSISFKVQGDGLTYQWFYKESYMKDFKISTNKSSAYAYAMQSYMNNRQVYCVITDQYGNQVTTDAVTIHLSDTPYVVVMN